MEKKIPVDEFQKLLSKKSRQMVYTVHAIQRARMRKIISENETEIKRFETDMKESPSIVIEQDSESPDERKFKLYYKSSKEGGFIAYIVSINEDITVITVYRTSKALQKKIYKYRKQR